MAKKLIMRTSESAFVAFIRSASETDAWNALGEAMHVLAMHRMSKIHRRRIAEIIELAEAAYAETFGTPWLPF